MVVPASLALFLNVPSSTNAVRVASSLGEYIEPVVGFMLDTYAYRGSDRICQISYSSAGAGVVSGQIIRCAHFGGAVSSRARYSFFHGIPHKDVFQFVGCRRVLSVGVKFGSDAAYGHSCNEPAQPGCRIPVLMPAPSVKVALPSPFFYVSAHGQTIAVWASPSSIVLFREVGLVQDA